MWRGCPRDFGKPNQMKTKQIFKKENLDSNAQIWHMPSSVYILVIMRKHLIDNQKQMKRETSVCVRGWEN